MRLFFISVFLVGCSQLPTKNILLEIKGNPGSYEKWKIHFSSDTTKSQNNQIYKSERREVGFLLENSYQSKSESRYQLASRTLEANSPFPLNDLGAPEVDETIEFEMDKTGIIHNVVGKPAQSIFYVPSLILPPHRVDIGAQWTDAIVWKDLMIPTPFVTTIVSTLAGMTRYKGIPCYKIEIQADTKFQIPLAGIDYYNHVNGYYFFDPKAGTMRYSSNSALDVLYFFSSNEKIETTSSIESLRIN